MKCYQILPRFTILECKARKNLTKEYPLPVVSFQADKQYDNSHKVELLLFNGKSEEEKIVENSGLCVYLLLDERKRTGTHVDLVKQLAIFFQQVLH